jgi:putative transposase
MSAKKYIVTLNEEDRAALKKVARSTHHSVREKTRARILLLADTGCSRAQDASLKDEEIATRLRVAPLTVSQLRKRACERGAVESIAHKEQAKRKARKLDGGQEAQLIAITCSAPPDGQKRWTLKLLRERLIAMEVVEDIGTETIRTTLKKTNSSRG